MFIDFWDGEGRTHNLDVDTCGGYMPVETHSVTEQPFV